jgi:hypothetical protein
MNALYPSELCPPTIAGGLSVVIGRLGPSGLSVGSVRLKNRSRYVTPSRASLARSVGSLLSAPRLTSVEGSLVSGTTGHIMSFTSRVPMCFLMALLVPAAGGMLCPGHETRRGPVEFNAISVIIGCHLPTSWQHDLSTVACRPGS